MGHARNSDPAEQSARPKRRKNTKAELLEELGAMRQRLSELAEVEARRDQAEEMLRDSEARFRSVLDICSDCIMEIDCEAKLLSANRGLPGVPSELVAGESVYDYFPESHRQRLADHLARVIETAEEDLFEIRYSSRGGEMLSVEVRIGPVLQGGKLAALTLVSTDVTRRKKAEEVLREVEARADRWAKLINEVFWLYDPAEKRRTHVSPASERIWEYPVELSQDVLGSDSIHAEDRERVREAFESKAALGRFDEVYRIVRTDGEIRWIHDRSLSPNEGEHRIAGIAEDITERKLAEEKIHRYEDELRSLRSEMSRIESRKHRNSALSDVVFERLTASKNRLNELGESLKYTRWAPTIDEVSTLVEQLIEETRSQG
jgi:PAS domain S-box-containing protein